MSHNNLFEKDPESRLDYSANWTAWLGDDDINTSNWIVPPGITKINESNSTKIAVIWLEGGTVGETYLVVNRIITMAGRIEDRTLFFRIKEK